MRQSTISAVMAVTFVVAIFLCNVARGQFHNDILTGANFTLQRSPPPRNDSFKWGVEQKPPSSQEHLLLDFVTEPSAEATTETDSGTNCVKFSTFFLVEVIPVIVTLGVLHANHVM